MMLFLRVCVASLLCIYLLSYVSEARKLLPKRSKRQLTFLGHDHASKRPLSDFPIRGDHKSAPPPPLNVEIYITPSSLTTPNGFENINIAWYNKGEASSNDWIGVYSPSNASNDEYLDYFHSDAVINGSYQVRVWNMRSSYQVRYFSQNDDSEYILRGVSNEATVDPFQPLQGHLSLTENSPYEMQIRWVSALVTDAIVKIGTESGEYTVAYDATSYTYDTTYMCGGTASIISPTQFRDPGFIYTVVAAGLKPSTKYYYIFGSASKGMSDEYSFTTSFDTSETSENSSDDSDSSFEFVMYGDQGTYENAYAVVESVESVLDEIDLVLHIGDLSYAWGNGYTWEIWSNMVSNIASRVPYMVSVGNHEYDHTSPCNAGGPDLSGAFGDGYHPSWGNQGDDSNGECGAPTYFRYNASLGGNSVFWYSFDYNRVHFIMLSSEHNYTRDAPAMEWLIDDLEQVRNESEGKINWIVVNIHRPLYESEDYASDNLVGENLLTLLEPTLFKYGVDLVLAGHYHAYERVCAVYNYTCVGEANGGITHMTIGTAGIDLDDGDYNDVEWSEYRDEIDWGFGRFYVNKTNLVAQFVTNQIGVVDEVVLTK